MKKINPPVSVPSAAIAGYPMFETTGVYRWQLKTTECFVEIKMRATDRFVIDVRSLGRVNDPVITRALKDLDGEWTTTQARMGHPDKKEIIFPSAQAAAAAILMTGVDYDNDE